MPSFGTATNVLLAIAGGPGQNESLAAWRARLQADSAEQERAEQERAEKKQAEERAGLERRGAHDAPVGHSSSSGGGGSEHLFRVQVASFADLHELTRENREILVGVKRLLGQPAAPGVFPSGTELTDKLGELDSLIAMAKTLGEMTVRLLVTTAVRTQHDRCCSPSSIVEPRPREDLSGFLKV